MSSGEADNDFSPQPWPLIYPLKGPFALAIPFPKVQPQASKARARAKAKPSRLLRTRDAAHYLSISPWTLRNLVRNGELPVVSDGEGSPWRFDQRDLDAYIERRRQTF
jgi:excisionase family DNA binding protein